MKKFLLISLLLSPLFAYATSGTCYPPVASYCTTSSDYRAHCGVPDQYTYEMYNVCHADCASQINRYQADLASYHNCLSQQNTEQYIPRTSAQDSEKSLQQAEAELQKTLDSMSATCNTTLPFTTYSQTSNTCVCITGYQSYNGQCVTHNTAVCYQRSGRYASIQGDGNCGCNQGYYLNEADVCTYGTKPTISLTKNVKGYVDNGNTNCFNNTNFSHKELDACIAYQAHPKYYQVVIVDSLDQAPTSTQKESGFFDDMPTPVSSATVKNKTKVTPLEKNTNTKPSKLLSGFTIGQPTSTPQLDDKVISTSTVNNVQVPLALKNVGRLNHFYHSFISFFKFF